MKITTKREKHWIDILPSISISWIKPTTIYIGWIFWNIVITIK